MAMTINKAGSDTELREIAALADVIWHECFPDIISEGQIDYMVEKFQSYKAMTKQIIDQDYSYFSVRDDGELCGYIGVRPEKDNRFFLSKLYLRHDKRGRGIASEMLGRVYAEARDCGKTSVYLTVNKHNDHAIAVYKNAGFTVIDEAVTDIGGGYVMDDYILSRDV
ncbi:GNAT family N-acetyltransferase [uncultured Ruminococcus sp.]|uniref:GNAT family N-acetyltransferase n=1 Tax=uncultured Ruminococcus sp. TaxID=165186 RepID=UPI00260FC234|nr:GNAT family N-acetyltransferase [uncultured Ruminococcus sp.]